jgi:RNA 2',3'-cyclic 3'-phosphodiesterase
MQDANHHDHLTEWHYLTGTTMRLFTGIAIGAEVLDALEQVMRELRPLAPLNWSPVENLHITSKFIGEWPEQRLGEMTQALGEIHAPAAFTVRVGGFGYLPNPRNPRMLYAGVQAGPELGDLARLTEDALAPLGVAREERAYTPHVTLSRIGARTGNKPIGALREHIVNMKNVDFGTFQVAEFHLYLSTNRPGGSGSVYKALATFPLGSHA